MARVRRGVAVRFLYILTIAVLTSLVVIMNEGMFKITSLWIIGAGIVGLIIECIITMKMTQGFDWKWFNPATVIFSANCLACIWFIQIRALSYSNQGVHICTNNTHLEELRKLEVNLLSDWLDFCGCGHCNGAAEQLFVIMLLIGRYFLPRGVSFYHPDDKINTFLKSLTKTHYILVIACNGADTLDMLAYSRYPGVQGNNYINGILLILFSVSMVQFCIDRYATTVNKNSDMYIVIETDLWSSLLILLTDDIPFFTMRLFLMVNYQVFSPFGTYFIFKNILNVAVTVHKTAMIWIGKDMEEIEEYVTAVSYTPEPPDRSLSSIGTPDDLDDISDDDSHYSQNVPVKSRAATRQDQVKVNDWGDQSQWFEKGNENINRERTDVSAKQVVVKDPEAETEEQTPAVSLPKLQVSYFTDDYAEEREATMDIGRVGTRKVMTIPLGDVRVRGQIDFSHALPRPEIPESSSPKTERKSKKSKSDMDELDESRDTENSDGAAVEDVSGEEKKAKHKKKKKKKDKEKDRGEDTGDDRTGEEGEDTEGGDSGERKHKKKKKKKSKSAEKDEETGEESGEGKGGKEKKKKKSKDRDEETDGDDSREKEKKKKKKKSKDKGKDGEPDPADDML